VIDEFGGRLPSDRQVLRALPDIGDYVADEILLYHFGAAVLPIDANTQRVLRRLVGLPTPRGTKRLDFGRDDWLQWATFELVRRHNPAELAQTL
jgi:adenine-specific DNA glycosylase